MLFSSLVNIVAINYTFILLNSLVKVTQLIFSFSDFFDSPSKSQPDAKRIMPRYVIIALPGLTSQPNNTPHQLTT